MLQPEYTFTCSNQTIMLPEVEKLLRVQHHDQRIAAIDKELAGIPILEEDVRDKFLEDEKKQNDARSDLQQTEIAIKNLELDIDTRKDSITKLKVQQYETKKNDEFTRMGEEITRYGEEITALEDKEIELMEQAEAQKAAYAKAKAEHEVSKEDVVSELEDLADLAENLKKEREEEVVKRQSHADPIDDDVLYNYERLFKGKAGHAIVGLVDDVCQGCHMKVVKSTYMEVKGEKQLTTCENCGRILYYWTDDSVGRDKGGY